MLLMNPVMLLLLLPAGYASLSRICENMGFQTPVLAVPVIALEITAERYFIDTQRRADPDSMLLFVLMALLKLVYYN